MTLSVFVVLVGPLVGAAIALALRVGRSPRPTCERTPTSDGSLGESIPERVRRRVWQRDRGACVVCGTRDGVRFERIIALGRGAPNTVRNLELRCASCQRLKSPADETQRSGRSSSGLPATGDIAGLLEARGDRQ